MAGARGSYAKKPTVTMLKATRNPSIKTVKKPPEKNPATMKPIRVNMKKR